MPMAQLVTRIDDELAGAMDALVVEGRYESRSDIVRTAVGELLDRLRREEVGRRILDGYRRVPENERELAEARAASVALVQDEPW